MCPETSVGADGEKHSRRTERDSSEKAGAAQVMGEGNTSREGAAVEAETLSTRMRGEGTDWAGTKGECVAARGTGMGHCLSNPQESKSCENVAPLCK